MARKAIDPARRCLPMQEWPEPDRRAWEHAIHSGDPFTGSGPASHWRPLTRKRVASSYGRWLGFLQRTNALQPAQAPAERVTEDFLRGYARHLSAQVAPVTLANRLIDLGEAIRVMCPGADLSLLRLAATRMSARAKPSRNKRARYVHPQALIGLGTALLAESDTGEVRAPIWRALRARNGLMILFVATRGLRLANLAMIKIGRHLVPCENGYRLQFEPGETKNRRPLEMVLPAFLTQPINRYIEVHRPILMGDCESDKMWLSHSRTELTSHSIYCRFCELTERHLGLSVNPHLFRDCAATAIAIEDPKHVGIASTILHHTDPRIRDMHYIQAQGIEAMREVQADIAARRRDILHSNRRRKSLKRS